MPERDPTRPEESVEPVRPNVIREMGSRPEAPEANVLGRATHRAGLARSLRNNRTAAAIRLRRARLPGISGRWSALVLLGLFVASAIVVPLALHRALWVEAEAVLAIWFVIWAASLSWLGHSGRSVERDWGSYRSLWARLGGKTEPSGSSGWSWGSGGWSGIDFGSADAGGAGCFGVIIALLIVLLLYVTIGWVVPLVAIVLYTILRAMLNRVGEHSEETRGNLPLALARGVFWAAVFTFPLVLAVWAIHVFA